MNWTTILRQIGRAAGASRGRRLPTFPGRRPGRPRWPGSRRKSGVGVLLLLVVAAVYAYSDYRKQQSARPRQQSEAPVERPAPTRGGEPPPVEGDDGGIARLFRERKSDVVVEAAGVVLKVLPDDVETADGSSRHQRFTVQFASGGTVLVAHNIDLAERVPLRAGDRVRFRGEYEWNYRGGTVHWTHRDPKRRRADGWIEHAGRAYK